MPQPNLTRLTDYSPVIPNPTPEPRLVDRVQDWQEIIRDPPPELSQPAEPLIHKIDKMVTGHIHKQSQLNRLMKNIRRKIIRDYNLPFDLKELRLQQETCPSFKSIYDFLAHDILPSDRKAARTVQPQSEQYLLCNGLLFPIFLHETNDAKLTLQVVIPDTMVDKIISMYHDGLLSSHQGVMRTYLTMRQYYYMKKICFRQ